MKRDESAEEVVIHGFKGAPSVFLELRFWCRANLFCAPARATVCVDCVSPVKFTQARISWSKGLANERLETHRCSGQPKIIRGGVRIVW